MNVKTKLFMMVGLPVLALALLMVYGSNNFRDLTNFMNRNSSLQNEKTIILDGYHDITQAYIASVNALSTETVDTLQQFMDTNAKSTNQALAKIQEVAANSSNQMKTDLNSLSKQIENWNKTNEAFFALATGTMDANLEREKGELKAKEAFTNMRKTTEQLRLLISKKLEDPTIDAERRMKLKDALFNVLQGDRSAYQAFVTYLEVLATSNVQQANELAKVFDAKFKEAKELLIQGVHPLGKDGDKLKIDFALMFQVWSSSSKKTIALHTANMEKNQLRISDFDKAQSEFFALQNSIKLLDKAETERVDGQLVKMNASIEDFTRVYNAAAISCIVISVIITLLFARNITAPLKKTVSFAKSIADGDFTATLNISQKDEVGQVARAVQRIPETLNRLQDKLNTMTGTIDAGHLRHREDASEFQGAYQNLMHNVNTVADVFTGILDTVPMPLLALDHEYTILFMNKFGAELDNEKPERIAGKKCFNIFNTSDCNTDNCACRRAMASKAIQSSETDAHPQAGDLEIKYIGAPNYMRDGTLAGAFEMIIDQTDAVRSHTKMIEVAGKAAEIAERLSSASDEISAQVEESSKGAEVQRDRSTETASAMEEMNATVLEVAQNASDAAGSAEEARLKAMEGSGIVKKVVEAISLVQDQAMGLQQNMSVLGEQAQDIGRIMNVISDIADQTNLLALNAAIEAARAGEAGRGFAVVADEVRKLAEKTMQATVEVEKAISNIQNGAQQNVAGTEKAVEAVTESTELAGAAGNSLSEILQMSDTTADQVRNIATAAEQQSSTADEIARSTDQIHRISTETADAMAQSAQAVYELAQLAGGLRTIIDELQGKND